MDELARPRAAGIVPAEQSGVDPLPTADGSLTLHSARYRQTYHSHHGALAESRHVFLGASGVGERLESGRGARVLEVGFGTGLNFFLTAESLGPGSEGPAGPLEYVTLERNLLAADVVGALGYAEFAPWSVANYIDFRRSLPVQPHPGRYWATWGTVSLELIVGEAQAAALPAESFDFVYQDAFSPDSNPELWSSAFLGELCRSLRSGGRLVSYTVKGEVRRRLSEHGMEVRKLPGPAGGKREMLLAAKP